jgi:hypothetical protein
MPSRGSNFDPRIVLYEESSCQFSEGRTAVQGTVWGHVGIVRRFVVAPVHISHSNRQHGSKHCVMFTVQYVWTYDMLDLYSV